VNNSTLHKPPGRAPVAVRPPIAITVDSPPAVAVDRLPQPKSEDVQPKSRASRPGKPAAQPPLDRGRDLLGPAAGALLAVLTVYLAFNAGGFFPGSVARAALVICVLLVLAVALIRRPFAGFGPAWAVPAVLLAGFAVWTLASALWSDAAGRALLEFDRALLYLLVFTLFGVLGAGGRRLDWGLRGLAVAAVAVCAVGWITRVAADLWPIAANIHPERLSFPITYWNALGLLATFGILACVHLSSGERESRGWRIAGAAAIPLLASTLLLTFSRGSIAVAFAGLVVYVLLARPRRLLTTLAAVILPTAVATVASYQAELLSTARFASSEGVSQGHELALVVLACAAVAAVLRALLLRADRALDDWVPPVVEPRAAIAAAAVGAFALIGLLVAFQAPARVGDQYDGFVNGDVVESEGDARSRLTSGGNNGRIVQAEVALDAFAAEPLHGTGAGTYELQWDRQVEADYAVLDAHSLYAEVLGELGVVGLLLVGGALVAIAVGLARRLRGEDRHVHAVAIALVAAWAVHAGLDWDWEMPVVTVWLFALAGLALSRPRGARQSRPATFEPGWPPRLLAALCVGALALVPAAIAVSQSRLDAALGDFARGDCTAAIASAQGSLDVLDVRPEPYEVLGYCQARSGEYVLAEEALERAVENDPESWRMHYGLALVRALAGRDPLSELYEARRLNPLERKVAREIRAMRGGGPEQWQGQAQAAALPL
jgi:O-antigen ligase